MTDEARLIAAAARGDRDAFERLVQSRQQRVFWTAYQVVGNEDDARDIAQQVFIRLWRALPGYHPRWPFDGWLHRITINLAIDAYRRRQARPETPAGTDSGQPPPAVAVGDPAGAMGQREVQRIFLHLARRLSAQQRAVFVLKEMHGLASDEIGALLAISPSTVRNHLHQARKILRRGLVAHYPEYVPARHRGPGDPGDSK
jgi:RNA polymerase sigma-70 factor (ECF subfamily)